MSHLPEPGDPTAVNDELSFDEADAFGFDATGRDDDPRFPYTVADLTTAQRQRLAALRAAAPEPTAAQPPAGDDEPAWGLLSNRDAAALAAALVEDATADSALDAPRLQVLYRYAPTDRPARFDLTLIDGSVWRCWPGADALPDRVDLHTFLGLLSNLPHPAPWAQPEPHVTVVGFSLLYNAPAEPGPTPSADYAVRDEPARVMVAVDADGRRYHHVHHAADTPGQVAVWEPFTVGPVDTPNRVTPGDSSALNQLHRLMDRLQTPDDPPADTQDSDDDDDVLVPGDIVSVTADVFDDDERAHLWVVVDDFSDYAIAVLGGGGNGIHWRNVPRGALVRATPRWIRRTDRHDSTIAYADADPAAPVLVEEEFHRRAPGGYELTRVYRLAGQILRIGVRRDLTLDASLAHAHLLDPPGGHTAVADTPAPGWYPTTPADTSDAAPLVPVAEELLQRAARILTPPETTGT